MNNTTEQEEREYLEVIKERLVLAIKRADESVKEYSRELKSKKEYIYEHQSGMDEADMVAAGQSINRMAYTGESAVVRKRKLNKLLTSPYFARIDFAVKGESPTPLYIGIHSFADETMRANVIYDWRAPVSSMFYDFELGNAWYETPTGKVDGEITLKRQYRIREGKMEFMIENSLNIQDDVLQKELSKSSDDRMKNIVATIQRDQNAVIRNEDEAVMIIQGVAGSGKTSIALHRVAFLLYKFRDTIRSKDILIISPNKVFADYISSVLPELGEEHIPEMGMDELASDLLGNQVPFQSFFKQVNHLLDRADESFVERIRFKSSFQFLSKLNQYFVHITNNYFEEREIRVAGMVVPGPFISEKYKSYHRMPLLKRIPEVVKDILQHVRTNANRKLSGNERNKIMEEIPKMFRVSNLFEIYRDFYKWMGRDDMLRMNLGAPLEYADVFPLIYCKIRLEGTPAYDHVKHLVIDEMQDYTPIQYAVISRIFLCRKTILGDVSQTVNPYSASSAETIEEVFPQGKVVKLFRSYRSTYEITQLAQRIRANDQLIAMERHGEQPAILSFDGHSAEMNAIVSLVADFNSSTRQSMGIICKNHQQANTVFQVLKGPGVHLLSSDSTAFKDGVVITTAHIAKGLEFDEVIVPFVSASNYSNDVDRSMLYIACTRAMHKLTLTHTKEATSFLK